TSPEHNCRHKPPQHPAGLFCQLSSYERKPPFLSFFTIDKKQTSPELLQAKLLPTQEEQMPANPPSQKRQIDSDSDIDDKLQLKRARLTRKNLACFNKVGKDKKKGSKKSLFSHHDSTSESHKTKTTSTTSSGFTDQAYKNGILSPLHSKPPMNLEDIQKRHARSRETASPPETKYKQYVNNVGKAGNEATMPDFVEGLEKREYEPFPVDEHVSGAKGRGKNLEEARLQSSYDGAALVYARNQALSYMGRSDPPGHAEESEDGAIKYHQYRIKSINLIDSYQEFKDGRRSLRNAQDYAKDQSSALRDDLREHWKQNRQHHSTLPSVSEETYLLAPDSQAKLYENTNPYQVSYETSAYEETATYEDEADYGVVDQPHSKRRSS
ncbi:hypothetical protein ACQKWADRAFT_325725, partial [Trichoderma austrokoningii]